MDKFLEQFNVATLIVLVLVVTGAVVTIVNPDSLSFGDYILKVSPLVGGLAVGRGIASARRSR